MNLFSKIFGSSDGVANDAPVIPWKTLTTLTQLDELLEESNHKTVAIFKHSTRCGISSMTLRRFESEFDTALENVSLFYLDLLQFRDISDQIVAKFGVMHQSPQLIVLKNGQVVHAASHYDIQANTISNLA